MNSLIVSFASLVLASATVSAQQARPAPTLVPGSPVGLAPLAKAEWIQGEAPEKFEVGKVYVFECWATWCGPCIAVIPHVNELHKKYFDKGLRIYGMNVWEDGLDKVEKFVKTKGDGMSYPVAYTGKGSDFENQWLKPAGVTGIPRAFVVRNGKLEFTCHPSQLSESLVEQLLSGDEGAKKASGEILMADEKRRRTSEVLREFRQAAAKNDTDTMAAKIEEFTALDPNSIYKPSMMLDLHVAKQDWDSATRMIDELPAGQARMMTVTMMANRIAMHAANEAPDDFVKALAKAYQGTLEQMPMRARSMEFTTLARLQWRLGDKEAALKSAKQAAEDAQKQPAGSRMSPAPFDRFAKAVEGGEMPTPLDFSNWMREAMQKPGKAAAQP
jgi:thiol-disulfide isomerase/thioredoxin